MSYDLSDSYLYQAPKPAARSILIWAVTGRGARWHASKPFPQGIKTAIHRVLQHRVESQAMNSTNEMSHKEVLRVKLEVLRQEHRDLDEAIHAMQELRRADQLTIRRLKAKKLQLKDQISKIEDDLTPDIIA